MTGLLVENQRAGRAWRDAGVAFALTAQVALSAPTPVITTSYGQEYVTVGAPGNRAMLPVERYWNLNQFPNTEQVGRVNFAFRIARTEVTSVQWRDFLNVAWPAWEAQGFDPSSNTFCGSNIGDVGVFSPVYFILPGRENWANAVSWRAAAMYCNWLHNGRPTGPNAPMSAFLGGAYDVTTFTRNPDGSYNDQAAHSPGAKYWIPTLDEWTKAGYYDPNRYAKGNPGPTQNPSGGPPITGDTSGYWLFPNGSQAPPASQQYTAQGDVGLHSDVTSPWGVLDMNGTASEWTETIPFPPRSPVQNRHRYYRPGGAPVLNDEFFNTYYPPDSLTAGLRIASLVPAPSSGIVVLVVVAFPAASRRRGRFLG